MSLCLGICYKMKMKKVKLYLNYAGHCFANENDAIKGGKKKKIMFPALWGIIHHPDKGMILYDTGYSDRFFSATKRYPNKIYAIATKVVLDNNEDVKSQLIRNNINPDDIKHIIITHFHADHVCGLKDFKNAQFYTSRRALDHVLKIPRPFAFTKAILKDLIPKDIKERTIIIDEKCTQINDPIFKIKYDLFNDSSLYIYDLPGHAAGQIGVSLKTEKNDFFLISDACWLKQAYLNHQLPNPIVKLFFDSWKQYKKTIEKINLFHEKNPETIIVPTHCLDTTNKLINSTTISFDEL
jgi:glyoxylase-like metal-dependent hydrolase (beta-lactamase superfamily II)